MKLQIFSIFALTCLFSEASVVVTGADNFTASNTNTTTEVVDDTVEFSVGSGNDQGVGVTMDTSAIVPTVGGDLYFQFGTTVVSREVQFFYGKSVTGVSSSGASRANDNAFSVGIDTGGEVFYRNQGTAIEFSLLSDVPLGAEVFFDIVVHVDSGIDLTYDVTASYFDTVANELVEQTVENVVGNQNGINNLSDFSFNAVGTQGLGSNENYTVSDFVASDMPIEVVRIPEPSSIMMLAAGSLLMLRRRRA